MPWVPITAQAHDEKRLEIAADGLRVPETDTVENVPKAEDLSDWVWDQYHLESGLSGSWASAAARLIITVSGLEANANLTLLYVAAEAQYNRAEASANIRVSGYVGPEAGKMFPEFGTFDIESYVKLMQSLSEMREVIGAKEEHIRPTRLWAWAEEETGATDRPTLLRVRTGRSAIVVDFAPSGPLQGPRRTVVGERSAENDNPERTPSARGARYLDAIQRDTGRE